MTKPYLFLTSPGHPWFWLWLFSLSMPVMAITWTNQQPADLVLGQANFTTAGGGLTANTLGAPVSVAVDPTTNKVFVSDYPNCRVLRFGSVASLTNGAAAEAVLGQPNFTSGACTTSATGLNMLGGITVDSAGRLWVADFYSNRVLRFDNASSIVSGAAANGVLGQPDFTSNSSGATQSTLYWPKSVVVDSAGRLWVTDQANRRVLRFDNAASKANGANADGVLGQPNFTSNATNLTQNGMNMPEGVTIDSAGNLFVADLGNHRVLRFNNAAAKANGANADAVLGQPDFTSNTNVVSATGTGSVRGVAIDSLGQLYVSDADNNNRILVYQNAATLGNGAAASYVLGQPDFTSNTANNGGVSATSLSFPFGLFFDNANDRLWVTDFNNSRVLRYAVAYNLTLATTGNGTGTISSSGTPAGVSCGADCLTYVSSTTVTLTATGTNGSTFAGWSCSPAFTSGSTLTANTTCNATFNADTLIAHHHLSVLMDGAGTGKVTGAGSYPAGTRVTLEAIPDPGSIFDGWSEGCSETMILTADMTCTATFEMIPPRFLHITFAGTGQGQLTGGLASDPTGINCSTTTPTCSYAVFGPQWVYPKLTLATGSEFAGWSGDPACTQDGSSKILLLQDTHCIVTVNLKSYTLSVGRNVPGVTFTGDGLNCQDTPQGFRNLAGAADLTACQASYPHGTTVKITASPAPLEWEWVGWKGSCDSQGQVVMTQDRLCQAQYREDPNVPNGIDGNGDGENDARQPHVMSLADKVAGSYITLVVNPECAVADSSTLLAESLDGHDPNHPAPQGLMYFELRCSQTPVTMYFHGIHRIPRNVELLKYGPTTPGDETTVGWYQLPDAKFSLATVGGQPVATVTYTLTDGQLGDNTGVDGKIVDPAGLGLK